MRWRKGLRNGDRENEGAWRGGRVEGEGIRDKRWNRLERRREGELLGTEARGGTAWNGSERGELLGTGDERETDNLFTTIKSLVEYEKILHQIAIYTLNSVKFKNILEFLC